MSQTNSLPASNAHFIDLTTASALTANYRGNYESILATAYQNADVLPLNETFNRNALDALLAQEGCVGIRIYYGMGTDNKLHAVLVGVDENNEDILPSVNSLTNEEDIIVELAQRCPDLCPPASPLNN